MINIMVAVDEVNTFLDAEDTSILLVEDPSKFMDELKSLLSELEQTAKNIDAIVINALDAISYARDFADDTRDHVEDAILELQGIA